MRNNIILTTNTLYDLSNPSQKLRSDLSLNTVKNAVDAGYQIIVVDVGSPISLVDKYKSLGADVFISSNKGMGAGRREAIKRAVQTNKEAIVWLEPEKDDLIRSVQILAEPILSGNADMVIPKRRSLSSYPNAQQYSESFANEVIKKTTGYDLDLFFGPRVLRKDLANYFLDYDGKFGDLWDELFVPVIWAIKDKKRIESVAIDFTYPKEQQQYEDNDVEFYWKRLFQINNILPAIKETWYEKK